MSEENNNNTNNNQNEECLRDNWADVGKGLGKTFSGLGKSLVRTAKVGMDSAADWADGKEVDRTAEKAEVKQGWKDFGHSFVDTAEDFGKASVKSVQKGVDKVDAAVDDSDKKAQENTNNAANEATGEAKNNEPLKDGEFREL